MKNLIASLNKAFDHRVRLGIMSALMVNDELEFKVLKDLLAVSDGNLASHIKHLEKEQYINIFKQFKNKKPNTTYKATTLGKKAFQDHLNALEKIINQ